MRSSFDRFRPNGSSPDRWLINLLIAALLLLTLPGACLAGCVQPIARSRQRHAAAVVLAVAAGVALSLWAPPLQWAFERVVQAAWLSALDHLSAPYGGAVHEPDPMARLWEGLAVLWLWTATIAPAWSITWAPEATPRKVPPSTGIKLGRWIEGSLTLWRSRSYLSIPDDQWLRHAVVLGSSGSGKTETLLRIADQAMSRGWSVIFIDPKDDNEVRQRFAESATRTGASVQDWPSTPYDLWRAAPSDTYHLLLELGESDHPYYDAVRSEVLGAALFDAGPTRVRSSRDFIHRLNAVRLRGRAGRASDVDGVAMAYSGLFRVLGNAFDGGFAFEDARHTYIGIPSLRYGRSVARQLAAVFALDAAQYIDHRKPRNERCLLIFDEFTAAGTDKVISLVERGRSYGAGVILASQTLAGLGDETLQARLLDTADMVILHRLPQPESALERLGTEVGWEYSEQLLDGQATGTGSRRSQYRWKVPPDAIRALAPGRAVIVSGGEWALVHVQRNIKT